MEDRNLILGDESWLYNHYIWYGENVSTSFHKTRS
jgi:hypothetical protein